MPSNFSALQASALKVAPRLLGSYLVRQLDGQGAAVLIRAAEPLQGAELMAANRQHRSGISRGQDVPARFYIRDNPFVSVLAHQKL